MTLSHDTMTDDQRRTLIVDYFNTFDAGGDVLQYFHPDARVWFPKWGLAVGVEQIEKMFADLGGAMRRIDHHVTELTYIFTGGGLCAVEGVTHGEHRDGSWRAGEPQWGAGRWCDVFEINDWKIQRCYIYLDPDYANQDTQRYTWLAGATVGATATATATD